MSIKLETLLLREIDPVFATRARFILDIIAREKPKRILDIGCGRGFYIKALSLFLFPEQIHGIDINKAYIEKAQKSNADARIYLQTGSIYKLPYKSESIDTIICSEVFEHLKHEKKAIAEIARVLKPNGSLIVTVPNHDFPFLWDPLNWILMRAFHTHIDKNIWWLAGIWADHRRLYTQKSLRELFTTEKLHIMQFKYLVRHCLPFAHFLLYGIGKNLVERVKLTQFSRFHTTPSSLAFAIAAFFRFPSRKNQDLINSPAVGLAVHIKKKLR